MSYYTYHDNPDNIPQGNVLVFATSLKGDMRLGYGPLATRHHGAQKGKPMGFSTSENGIGKSFGIPFKDADGYDMRTLDILRNVDEFLNYTTNTKHITYHITDVAKVIPRIQPKQIAYLFKGAHSNCIFPRNWQEWMDVPELQE